MLEQHINSVGGKFQDKFCVTQESYDQIKEVLALGKGQKCQFGTGFKFWCKKNYRLEKIGSLSVVYCVKTSCPVVAKESIFETLVKCHKRVGHSARRKTWDEVKKNYAGIRFDVIPLFLSTCKQCNERRPAKNPPSGRPMIALGFLTRVQMDLIDFSSRPDGDYRYILHVRDHFSKYSWAYPLTSKRASEVAEKIVELFCMFGPAKILQSDNGREFTASVIEDIKGLWPDMIIIHGRPRHPQSQGLIERGNGDLQLKLGKWMDTNGESWSKGLRFVIHTINTSVSRITSKSPYEVVFGQTPHSDFHILENLAAQGIVHEEDIPEDIPVPGEEEHFDDGASDDIPDDASEALQADDNLDGLSDVHGPNGQSDDVLAVAPTSSTGAEDMIHTGVDLTEVSDNPHSDVRMDQQQKKRGCEYLLLKGDVIVASGREVPDQSSLNGIDINLENQAIIAVDEIHESTSPDLHENEQVVWDRGQLIGSGEGSIMHKAVRLEAQRSYLKAAAAQRNRHQIKVNEFVKDYAVGDTGGVKIHTADRTNTDARLLPCKVMEVSVKDGKKSYRIYSASGILKNKFAGEELT